MFAATGDSNESQPSTSSSMEYSQSCVQFKFPEILLATDNFDDSLEIGHGGFGKVYRGTIIKGSSTFVAAIKRLDSKSSQGAAEFWAEVEMLSKLRHCHLVSLLGYCNFEKEMILVYEYMPNGTLADHLHKLGTPLSWIQRLKICSGAASGLHYLHTGMGVDFGVIHRDVKTSNILLSESWAAKISDFGLSKIGPTNQPSTYVNTIIKGTFGYLDPEYFYSGRLTRKSDVFAFGVVLLEVLCRKPALDRSRDIGEENLAKWAQDSIKEGNLKHIIDPGISCEISPKCLKEFVRIAKRCLLNDGKQRPTMVEVVFSLESIVALQEKMNNSLQLTSRTIFGWMFPYLSSRDNSGKIGPYSTKEKCTSPMKPRTMESPHVKSPRSGMEITEDVKDLHNNPSYGNLDVFTYEEMRIATKVFRQDQVLGEGGFGIVYKGVIDENVRPSYSKIQVAIKKLNTEGLQGHREWLAEVNYLGQLQHPNLVKLIGYCCDDDRRLLVYEYMPSGSLERHLYRRVSATLTWSKRMKIALHVAKALAFLHDAERPVIYRDFKTSNILLDAEFNAKLSDFGLAKDGPMGDQTHVSTQVMGTYGYAAPEYIMTGHLTARSDIYGFGVVLLEMLTGRRAMDKSRPSREQNLVDWARPLLNDEKKLFKILDPRMKGQYASKAAMKVANLAYQCTSQNPKGRPAIILVVEMFESLQTNEVGLEEARNQEQ